MKLKVFAVIICAAMLSACGGKGQPASAPSHAQALPTQAPSATAQPAQSAPPTAAKETSKPAAGEQTKAGAYSDKKTQPQASSPPPAAPVQTEGAASGETAQKVVTVSVYDAGGKALLPEAAVEYKDGMTVYEALKAAAAGRLEVKSSGSGQFAYVQGIGGLSEFDKGPMSGWLYFVNGVKADKGAGAYKLNPGDKITWKYTLDGKE